MKVSIRRWLRPAWAAAFAFVAGAAAPAARAEVQRTSAASAAGVGTVSAPLAIRNHNDRFLFVGVVLPVYIINGTAITFESEPVPLRECFVVAQTPYLAVCLAWIPEPPAVPGTLTVTAPGGLPTPMVVAAAAFAGVDQEEPFRARARFGDRSTDSSSQLSLLGGNSDNRVLSLMAIRAATPGNVSDLRPGPSQAEFLDAALGDLHLATADARSSGIVTARWDWSLANVSLVNVHYHWLGDLAASTAIHEPDSDLDGVPDVEDLCPATTDWTVVDASGCADVQTDADGDGQCDPAALSTGPSQCLGADNCPQTPNADQADLDVDGLGDACDDDDDDDGSPDVFDNCPTTPNSDQANNDGDLEGDACDGDDDDDSLTDDEDNCPLAANPQQENLDGDLLGDPCDGDVDDDGAANNEDNCPTLPNADQSDLDEDAAGDACDDDDDGDGVTDAADNCPAQGNADQSDFDSDLTGDECDEDDDNDGFVDAVDPCPRLASTRDGCTVGDSAPVGGSGGGTGVVNQGGGSGGGAPAPQEPQADCADGDADGVCDADDNCPQQANAAQADPDEDGLGDECDNCPTSPNSTQTDDDDDAFGNACDNCKTRANSDQADADADGIGDACEGPEPIRADADEDGVPDGEDNCPQMANPDQTDSDHDDAGDACDRPGVVLLDADGDGLPDDEDNCPSASNADQADVNEDGVGDACEPPPEPLPQKEEHDVTGTARARCGNGMCGAFGSANLALLALGMFLTKTVRRPCGPRRLTRGPVPTCLRHATASPSRGG